MGLMYLAMKNISLPQGALVKAGQYNLHHNCFTAFNGGGCYTKTFRDVNRGNFFQANPYQRHVMHCMLQVIHYFTKIIGGYLHHGTSLHFVSGF